MNIKNREQRESVKLKGAKKLPNEKARNKKEIYRLSVDKGETGPALNRVQSCGFD